MRTYDIAVIGAGPAGLMAAGTAAAQGLHVVLLEKCTDISVIRRACCQQFVMDENYESENISVTKDRVVFPHNGFSVDYAGPRLAVTDTYFTSPSGRSVHFSYADKRPIAIKFDKGQLLQTLLDRCRVQGVDYRNSTLVCRARDNGDGVYIDTTRNGKTETLAAKKIIAADGVNSRTAATLGANRDRALFATALCIIYCVEGVSGFDPSSMRWHMGRAYFSFAPVIFDPCLEGPHLTEVVVMGSAADKPDAVFHKFTTQGPCAAQFNNARVVRRTACTVRAYAPMTVPHLGNALFIGDAAAYVEVEVQGALMCGFHAGRAAADELAGSSGFDTYTAWWQRSFEFNSAEALRVAQGYALVPTYEDEEIDYLFGLIEGRVLDGAYGQYRAPKLLWDALLEHSDAIARERPALFEKIQNNSHMTLSDTFRADQ